MKQFDLEAAKNGAKVTTEGGHEVRIICTDANNILPVVALITIGDREVVRKYSSKGSQEVGYNNKYRLGMASVKKTGWINLYLRNDVNDVGIFTSDIYTDEKTARLGAMHTCIDTVKIEWEE